VCVNGACQACSADAQCGAGARCANNRCERVVARVDEPNDSVAVRSQDGGRCFENVYFAFDDDRIDDGGQRSLRRAAECLTQERTTRYVLIGRADPRGTSEYNLALGERRARSVQRFLAALGVSADRLPVSSEGSEAASGTDESGWSRDRRVETTATASRP
jgi:peptidoglycan-associated lipoprotein